MKLESPYINPINFSSSELESESYRRANVSNCQMYSSGDYLQFIVYFNKDEATAIKVEFNGVAIETAKTFTSAVSETWGGSYIKGYRKFNKGYVVVRAWLKDFHLTNGDSLIVKVSLYNSGSSCELTSNTIQIVDRLVGKVMKYSNTYDNSVCDFSLLPNLFEYRFNGLFYKTELTADAEVFQGVNMSEVVSYRTNEQYILNIGGQDAISLTEERKIRHILGCNVKIIDGIEFELTPDVKIDSEDFFRMEGRSIDITLTRKQYQQSVMQVASGTGGTITTNRPVTYDTTSSTFAVDPAELTAITVTDSNNRTTLNKTLVNGKDIIKVDYGINQNLDEERTIEVTFTDSTTTKTVTITQKYSGLLFGDAIMNKNLILRKLP